MRKTLLSTAALCAGSLFGQAPGAPAEPAKTTFRISADPKAFENADPFFGTKAYLRRRFETPVYRVELQAPTRLKDFVVDGKLELGLRNYLDLVLANNPDVTIQKLQVEDNRNAITRSAGIFDPAVTARFTATRSESPSTNTLAGATVLSSLNQPLNIQYTQLMQSGTLITASFNGSKLSNNNAFQFLNPNLSTNLQFNISQPLIRSRTRALNRLPITIAQVRLKTAEFQFEDALLQLLVAAESAYWDVVQSRENLRVQEEALKLADESLKRSKRELELGAISQLEIYQPEAQLANAQIFVTQARFRLAQTEDALRRQMGADQDPEVRGMSISLTEPVTSMLDNRQLDREELVRAALGRRQDLKSLRQNLNVDDLSIRASANALRPDLSLNASYSGSGTSGLFTRPITPGVPVPPAALLAGGIGTALSQSFQFTYPTYGAGVTLRFPIRDRAAAANYADALWQKKLDTYQIRSLEQNIRLQVLNAVNNVENSRASVELAKVARDLAQKRVEAEQKRYELGTTVIFFVLAAQTDLTTAESALVRELINYRRNLLTLLQRTGQLLDERGVIIQ